MKHKNLNDNVTCKHIFVIYRHYIENNQRNPISFDVYFEQDNFPNLSNEERF